MTACLVLTLVGMAHSEENVKIPPGDAPPPQLTLESALDRVIATDQTVAIADYEVRKAGLDEWRALTRVMPSLSLGADATWRGSRNKDTVEVIDDSSDQEDPLGGNNTTLGRLVRQSRVAERRDRA